MLRSWGSSSIGAVVAAAAVAVEDDDDSAVLSSFTDPLPIPEKSHVPKRDGRIDTHTPHASVSFTRLRTFTSF